MRDLVALTLFFQSFATTTNGPEVEIPELRIRGNRPRLYAFDEVENPVIKNSRRERRCILSTHQDDLHCLPPPPPIQNVNEAK